MKCKNCDYDSEGDFKHCPECGAKGGEKAIPGTNKKKALELITETHDKITQLWNEREERKKEAAKKADKKPKRKEKEDDDSDDILGELFQ